MARADNTYSRVVAGMKILLPLLALGLLSTLFMFSKSVDPTKSVPIAQIDLEKRAREQGAVNPRFAGVTPEGDEIIFAANMARPDPLDTDLLQAEAVAAQLRLSAGNEIRITSATAEMSQADRTAQLEGQVRLETSGGHVMTTDRLDLWLDELRAETPGRIEANGPLGRIEAGRMVLRHNPVSDMAELLFTEGVKLVYERKQSGD